MIELETIRTIKISELDIKDLIVREVKDKYGYDITPEDIKMSFMHGEKGRIHANIVFSTKEPLPVRTTANANDSEDTTDNV